MVMTYVVMAYTAMAYMVMHGKYGAVGEAHSGAPQDRARREIPNTMCTNMRAGGCQACTASALAKGSGSGDGAKKKIFFSMDHCRNA